MIGVLHLITTTDVGGAEASLLRVVPRMDRNRFRSAVVSITRPGALLGRVRDAGIEVHALSSTRSVGPTALWRLVALIRQTRPHVLQTWLYHADFLGLLAGRALRVPAISWNLRCAELERRDHPRSLFWMLAALARLSGSPDAVVVNSVAGRTVHEALGYRPRHWDVIPNGFDVEEFAPSADARRAVRQEWRLDDDALAVGLVARYHPMKDHRTFLEACGRVAATRPHARFVLAGRLVDEGNASLRALVERNGLAGRVVLLGEVAQPARLYQGLDLLVSSSYSEAFPNVVGEAMAAGVPVVATDAGDSARIVGHAGWIVPCRDPEALAAAVQQVLTLSPEQRRSRGLLGRRRIAGEFSLDRVVAQYESLYARLHQQATGRH